MWDISGLMRLIRFDIMIKQRINSGKRNTKDKYLKLYISWWRGNMRTNKGIPTISKQK